MTNFDLQDHGWLAWWASIATLVIAGWWKARLKVRQDARADKEEEIAADSYGAIIAQQRERIEELATDFANTRKEVHQLRNDLQTAHTERDEAKIRARLAEEEVGRLKGRVAILEDLVHSLEGRLRDKSR